MNSITVGCILGTNQLKKRKNYFNSFFLFFQELSVEFFQIDFVEIQKFVILQVHFGKILQFEFGKITDKIMSADERFRKQKDKKIN